jgi:hypothetical protein
MGSGGIAPRILLLGDRWRRVIALRPNNFNPRESLSITHPLNRSLNGNQIFYGRYGEEITPLLY